jgi:hypothetical protein
MPLSKDDAPANAVAAAKADAASKPVSESEAREAVNDVIDSGAGAPEPQREAAENLPDKNPMDKAIKKAYNANDAQTEAKAKKEVVEMSADSAETPSGHALIKTAGIADDVKRGEEYNRIKMAVRLGATIPAEDK